MQGRWLFLARWFVFSGQFLDGTKVQVHINVSHRIWVPLFLSVCLSVGRSVCTYLWFTIVDECHCEFTTFCFWQIFNSHLRNCTYFIWIVLGNEKKFNECYTHTQWNNKKERFAHTYTTHTKWVWKGVLSKFLTISMTRTAHDDGDGDGDSSFQLYGMAIAFCFNFSYIVLISFALFVRVLDLYVFIHIQHEKPIFPHPLCTLVRRNLLIECVLPLFLFRWACVFVDESIFETLCLILVGLFFDSFTSFLFSSDYCFVLSFTFARFDVRSHGVSLIVLFSLLICDCDFWL